MLKNKNKNITLIYTSILLIFLLGLLYFPVRNFNFINFDDNVYISENSHVNSGLNLKNVKWAFTQTEAGHWHPLTWISHQLDVSLFGLEAGKHHLMNVGFHILNTLLLNYLLYLLFGKVWLAFFASALFALHPQRLESVVWISERKDVLSLFFGLLCLHAYRYYAIFNKQKAFLLTHLFLFLGLLAKPSLVVFPLLFLVLDFWPFRRFSLFYSFKEKIGLFFLSAIFAITVFFAQKQIGAMQSLEVLPFADRCFQAFISYWIYLAKTFWPAQLAIFYPLKPYKGSLGVLAFLLLGGFTFFTLKLAKRIPSLVFSWLWFLISLLPVIGFIQIGGQAMADRWTYLAQLGLAIGLCGYLSKSPKTSLWIYIILVGCLSLAFSKSYKELPYWANSQKIFERALETNPNNFLAHTNLGQALESSGNKEAALSHYEEAVRLNPGYSEALNNLGGIKAQQGHLEEAFHLFQKALLRQPRSTIFRYNLALASYQLGDKAKALEIWLQILNEGEPYPKTEDSLRFIAIHDTEELCQKAKENSLENIQKIRLYSEKWQDQNITIQTQISKIKKCLAYDE